MLTAHFMLYPHPPHRTQYKGIVGRNQSHVYLPPGHISIIAVEAKGKALRGSPSTSANRLQRTNSSKWAQILRGGCGRDYLTLDSQDPPPTDSRIDACQS